MCDACINACIIAEQTGVEIGVGEIKAARGGRWWRYDGRDKDGDPIWTDVDCSLIVR